MEISISDCIKDWVRFDFLEKSADCPSMFPQKIDVKCCKMDNQQKYVAKLEISYGIISTANYLTLSESDFSNFENILDEFVTLSMENFNRKFKKAVDDALKQKEN